MIEPDFVDDENIPLLNENDDVDDSIYEDSQAETSFNNDDVVIQQEANEIELRRRERNLEKLDTKINALERGFNVKIPPEERGRFRMSSDYLQVEKSPGEYANISKSDGTFLAESTLRNRLGAPLARSLLGIETRDRVLIQEIPTELEMERSFAPKGRRSHHQSDERHEHEYRPRHARISRYRQGSHSNPRRACKQRGEAD